MGATKMATKLENVKAMFADLGWDSSNQDIMDAYSQFYPGETVGIDTVKKARFEAAQEAADAEQAEAEDGDWRKEDGADDKTDREEFDGSAEDAKQEVYEQSLEDEAYEAGREAGEAGEPEVEPEPQDTVPEQAQPYDNGVTESEGAPASEPAAAAEEPEVVIDRVPEEGRCNHRMVKALDLCGRPEGHPGVHTTYAQMEKKKAFSKARAMTRYHSDPEYAARVKEASRVSHKKAREELKAMKAELAAMKAAAAAAPEEAPADAEG